MVDYPNTMVDLPNTIVVTINVLSETRLVPVFYTRELFQTTDGKGTASG